MANGILQGFTGSSFTMRVTIFRVAPASRWEIVEIRNAVPEPDRNFLEGSKV